MTIPFDPFILAQSQARGYDLTKDAVSEDESESVDLSLRTVQRWAERTLDASAADETANSNQDVFASAASLGLFGLTIPAAYGGAEFSLMAAARVVEEISTVDLSLGAAIGVHCGLGLHALAKHGSAGLKDRFLPALAAGELICAFSATEPEAGSHIAGVKTIATANGANTLRLNGSKCFVTNGGVAGVFTVLARTPGLCGARGGHSLLLVTRDMPGVRIGRPENKLGLRGSSTTALTFEEVDVPFSHVIGQPGAGFELFREALVWGRSMVAAGCVGICRRARDRAVVHVLDRRQFGTFIGTFGLVREKIAMIQARLFASESVLRLTTFLESRHGTDVVWESAVAKIFASEAAWHAADDALQLHGGLGFIEDTGIARVLRDCRVARIVEGANEVLRTHVGYAGLQYQRPARESNRLARQLHPDLLGTAEAFDAQLERVAVGALRVWKRHGLRVLEHQLVLGRVANTLIGLYASMAVLLRANALVAKASGNHGRGILDLARYTCNWLAQGVERSLAGLDTVDEQLVHAVSDRAYERVQRYVSGGLEK